MVLGQNNYVCDNMIYGVAEKYLIMSIKIKIK